MRAIHVGHFGEPQVLQLAEVPQPVPGPNEVLVELAAAGVNPVDLYIRAGSYAALPELPYVPGFDGAGVVAAVGEGVDAGMVGRRVYVASTLTQPSSGTYAEAVVASMRSVRPLPESLSFAQGAALGVPATTAYRALFQKGLLTAGEIVLVQGASGSVGQVAVQLAVAAGARVIATAGSTEGLRRAQAAGAQVAINYRDPQAWEQIKEAADGIGPQLIIEVLANVNLLNDLTVLAPGGRVVVVGSRGTLDFDPRLLITKDAQVLGMSLWNTPSEQWNQAADGVLAAAQSGVIQPSIGATLALGEAADAHLLVAQAATNGKVVLEPQR